MYITHIYTQARREYDNRDEYLAKDSMLQDYQDNIQAREPTLRQTRHITM